jgi:hypothetical protein
VKPRTSPKKIKPPDYALSSTKISEKIHVVGSIPQGQKPGVSSGDSLMFPRKVDEIIAS